ncbi:glutathione S-transferase 3, mitochondrial-like [Sycon ciliatum]|uniref:glutathione S-transferase 3, mitochondrial-like n=1 Tax=Sycon ciliatum TaxID=27933 RepID=UPI0020AA4C96|eukprot:scpid79578/ scgid31713/ Microsomal glutathione S-transferase 3; Microsomal GST-III
MEISIAQEYGYVVLTSLLGSLLVNFFLIYNVVAARKKYDVKYPALYSPTNENFNCVQRAHQNYLENLTFFLVSGLVAGVVHPIPATACNVIYLIGRIVYALGYYTGDPEKRSRGGFYILGFLGNMLLASHAGLRFAGLM